MTMMVPVIEHNKFFCSSSSRWMIVVLPFLEQTPHNVTVIVICSFFSCSCFVYVGCLPHPYAPHVALNGLRGPSEKTVEKIQPCTKNAEAVSTNNPRCSLTRICGRLFICWMRFACISKWALSRNLRFIAFRANWKACNSAALEAIVTGIWIELDQRWLEQNGPKRSILRPSRTKETVHCCRHAICLRTTATGGITQRLDAPTGCNIRHPCSNIPFSTNAGTSSIEKAVNPERQIMSKIAARAVEIHSLYYG